jgi:hypothetical protein
VQGAEPEPWARMDTIQQITAEKGGPVCEKPALMAGFLLVACLESTSGKKRPQPRGTRWGRYCRRGRTWSRRAAESERALLPLVPVEPWHDPCRQIATGGLHYPDLAQRHQALFSLGALFASLSGLFNPSGLAGNAGG